MGCGLDDADGAPRGGFKTLINTGPDGGQEVYHLHLHVYRRAASVARPT